ncbi:MAG TPA: hypothetical protein VGN72_14625 [Tepidisphaeraceae bacterium]|jgi:hypothetical protein|nr:hypothetical protein [Tepidisphaeraceae bacterium]
MPDVDPLNTFKPQDGNRPDPPPREGDGSPVPKLDYEPWPQRRVTPKPVKVLIWVAIITHALGIIPAVAFLYYTATQDTRFIDMLSGGTCCFPLVALVALGLFFLMMKVGGHDER